MPKVNDGGPAFPVEMYDAEVDMDTVFPGLSLRDYFAAKVLQGLVTADAPSGFVTFEALLEHYAVTSYQYADAMLKERAKG
ncbi:hypothetical protein FHS82_000996 [Pseudochelatococcus lubricantis]|uniref:Uncharacterized protein n=1 Tax=Pseudochelatococcus lubricantis TaxID=1538102 RepID=A0ABX0UYZ7_9HYPH|nr:hypothetical protein [Pseudochelatococcus lubricantis]NIJ57170.1 hypothetical protein [Pseudochelatococcus lubricantis]